jgi:hypothetical protein
LEQINESRIERKKKEAKERILAAAEQLFVVEHSYDETTIREILTGILRQGNADGTIPPQLRFGHPVFGFL